MLPREDARTLSPLAQEEKRKQAIRLYLIHNKVTYIAEICGVRRQTVSDWIRIYKDEGIDGLLAKVRGRRTGDGRILSPHEEEELSTLLINTKPEEYGLENALWDRRSVKYLIKKMFNKEVAIRTIGTILSRLNFTLQIPKKKAYERDDELAEEWVNVTFPNIQSSANDEKAVILFADESGLDTGDHRGKGYAPRGETPTREVVNRNKGRVNFTAAVGQYGDVRFHAYNGTYDANVAINFLRSLAKSFDRKIYLVWDNLNIHKCKAVTAWLNQNDNKIKVFYLPPYCPELNPAEYLNCDLKRDVLSQVVSKTKEELKKKTTTFLRFLQRNSERVKKYFENKNINYAAA